MKVVWYLVTFVLGLLGLLFIIRAVELLGAGGAVAGAVVQLALGLLLAIGAWKSLLKARVA